MSQNDPSDEGAAMIQHDETSNDQNVDLFSRQMPRNASDPNAVDSLIAAQMAKLSVTDREKVYMDVHGIPDNVIAETPELIRESLELLEHEIKLLPERTAYELAAKSDPNYVNNPDFRLAFLRCEKFDSPKAALRIIRHFQMKLDLFGRDKLTMDITQDDLDVEDIEAVYSCSGRFLDAFDSGGRIINLLIQVPKMLKTKSVIQYRRFQLRRAFYNIMVAFRDEEVQRRGAVCVCWGVGDPRGTSGDNADSNWKLPMLNEGSPMRIAAVHMCYTDEAWKGQFARIRRALNENTQVRVRVHYGTVKECLNRLRGHGIEPNCIPLNENGEITDKLEHCQRMEHQRAQERLSYPLRKEIATSSSQDVLLGKGTPYQDHPGNKKLRQLVSDRYNEWENAPKGGKKAISEEVIDSISGIGGFFLKQDGDKWVLADHTVVRLKVSAAFRTQRAKVGTKSYKQE